MYILTLFIIPLLFYFVTRKLIASIIINSFAFIIIISWLQHYYIAFPLYIGIVGIMILLHYKNISFRNSTFSIIFVAYMIMMLLMSFIYNYNNMKDIIAVLFINLLFPFLYLYLDSENKPIKSHSKLQYLLLFASIFDLIVSTILFNLNTAHQAIINSQPIGGALAVALLPLLLFLFSDKKSNKPILLFTAVFFALSVLLSGIRGYIIIYFVTMLVYFIMNFKDILRVLFKKAYLSAILVFSAILIFVMLGSNLVNIVNNQLRLNDSLGRRNLENQYVVKLIESSSISQNLFGHGIGMKMSNIKSPYDFNFYENNDPNYFQDYEYSEAVIDNCISFHNSWATIIIDIGLIGILFYVGFFVMLLSGILHYSYFQKKERIVFITYVATIIIVLFFRETLFCSTLEMMSLYFAMNLKKQCSLKEDINV